MEKSSKISVGKAGTPCNTYGHLHKCRYHTYVMMFKSASKWPKNVRKLLQAYTTPEKYWTLIHRFTVPCMGWGGFEEVSSKKVKI